MYIKTFTPDGTYSGVQEVDPVVWIKYQIENGLIVRCPEEDAQGILSQDAMTFLFKDGVMPRGIREPYYIEISKEEFDYLNGDDPEDETPEIPDDNPEEVPMTRAELTERVTEQAERIEFLEECLLEMSEAIYA